MPRRLFLALLLLVAAPMVLLGWMSAGAVKTTQAKAKENLAALLSSQLHEADRRLGEVFDSYALQLDAELESEQSVFDTLRRMRRELPMVRQGIFVDPGGLMLFPPPDDLLAPDAAELKATLPGLVDARPLPTRPAETADDYQDESETERQTESPAPEEATARSPVSVKGMDHPKGALALRLTDSAWQQWYMADGAQVVYWRQRSDGATIGVLLQRSRWIADLIAALPDQPIAAVTEVSDQDGSLSDGPFEASTPMGSVSLVDEAKRIIYRWGDVPAFRFAPLVSTHASAPLASWQLRLHVNEALIPEFSPLPMYLSLAGIATVLLGIGFYVLTSVGRQIADAKSRVNFAGQVSHELRTPLTNIRLYTELAENDLEHLDDTPTRQSLHKRLDVIDHESRRLQRLVSGVLEMIRPTGRVSAARIQQIHLRELITGIADQFAPSFAAAGIALETDCSIDDRLSIDPDIVEMVLVNLLSNVEKYVPRDGRCRIECNVVRSSERPSQLHILVSDDGPGINKLHRKRIFRPFVRLDDSIDAPSGTGIGLTIAQRAARRHGGDLTLLSHCRLGGAAFLLSIPIASPRKESH